MTEPDDRLQEFARRYAAGELSWREIADETGAFYGEVLAELTRQGLALPTAEAPKTPEQQAMWEAALRAAADVTNDDDGLASTPWWWRTANGLALWVRQQRESQGLSIDLLAARTGLAPRTLENLEGGRVWHVHIGVLIRVADALGQRISFERRTGGSDDEA